MKIITILTFSFPQLFYTILPFKLHITNTEGDLQRCCKHITTSLFNPSITTVLFTDDAMINYADFTAKILINTQSKILLNSGLKITANYILVKNNLTSINKFVKSLTAMDFWHKLSAAKSNFLVITPEKNIEQLFRILWKYDIVSVYVISIKKTLENEDKLEIIHANPFSDKSKCMQHVLLENLGNCLDYQPKLKQKRNYENCPFKVSILNTFFTYPYLPKIPDYNYEKDLSQEKVNGIRKPGFVFPIFKLLQERLKLNVNYVVESQSQQLGYLKGNLGSNLKDKKLDTTLIMIAKSKELLEDSDFTTTFVYDPSVWLIPRSKSVSEVKMLVSVFQDEIWCLIVFCVLLVTIVLMALAKLTEEKLFDSFTECLLTVYSATLIMQSYNWRLSNASKILLLSYLLSTMNICYFYQAKLVSVLTKPIEVEGIKNVEELINSNLNIVIHVHLHDSLKYYQTVPIISRLVKRSSFTTKDGLVRLGMVANGTTIASVVMVSYLDVNLELTSKVKSIGDTFLVPCSLYLPMRRGHFLFDAIDDVLSKSFENGLSKKWLQDVKEVKYDNSTGDVFIALHLQHLGPVFFLLVFGLGISLVFFVVEVTYYKIKTRKNVEVLQIGFK